MTGARSNMAGAAFRGAFTPLLMPALLGRRLLTRVARVVRAERLGRAAHVPVAEHVPAERLEPAPAEHGPAAQHVLAERVPVRVAHLPRVRAERALVPAARRQLVLAEQAPVPAEHQRPVRAEQELVREEHRQRVLEEVRVLVPLEAALDPLVVALGRPAAAVTRQLPLVPHRPPVVAAEAALTTSRRTTNGDYQVQVSPHLVLTEQIRALQQLRSRPM